MSLDKFNRLCDESIPEKEKHDIKIIQDILKEDPMVKAALNNQTRLYIDEQFEPILAAMMETRYDKKSETREV